MGSGAGRAASLSSADALRRKGGALTWGLGAPLPKRRFALGELTMAESMVAANRKFRNRKDRRFLTPEFAETRGLGLTRPTSAAWLWLPSSTV